MKVKFSHYSNVYLDNDCYSVQNVLTNDCVKIEKQDRLRFDIMRAQQYFECDFEDDLMVTLYEKRILIDQDSEADVVAMHQAINEDEKGLMLHIVCTKNDWGDGNYPIETYVFRFVHRYLHLYGLKECKLIFQCFEQLHSEKLSVLADKIRKLCRRIQVQLRIELVILKGSDNLSQWIKSIHPDNIYYCDFENQYDSTGACSTAEKDSFSKNCCFSMNQHAYTLIKDQLVKCVGCSYGTSVIVGGIGYGKKWRFNESGLYFQRRIHEQYCLKCSIFPWCKGRRCIKMDSSVACRLQISNYFKFIQSY